MRNNDIGVIRIIADRNKIDKVENISRFTSGQVNHTYEINGKWVVKLEGDLPWAKGIFRHQREITDRLLNLGAKVPRVLDVGEIEGRGYILMERLAGKNMVFDWMGFDSDTKENFIRQLSDQLKIIHSVKYDDYQMPMFMEKKFPDLEGALSFMTDFKRIDQKTLPEEYLPMVEFLESFYLEKISRIDEKETAVLVHNDIHFENIFYDGRELTGIIDWDWASAAPKDYDLWRLVHFCCNPKAFVERRLELFYSKYKPTVEISSLRQFYPELFTAPDLPNRIRLYFLDHIISIIADYQSGKWDEVVMKDLKEKIDIFYKSDWVERFLEG